MGDIEKVCDGTTRLREAAGGRTVRGRTRTPRALARPRRDHHPPGEHGVPVQPPLPPLPPRGRSGTTGDHVPADDGGGRLLRPAVPVPGPRHHRRSARARPRPSFPRRRARPARAAADASDEPFRLERRGEGVAPRALRRPPRRPGRLVPLDESVPGGCPAWRGGDGSRDRRAEEVERRGIWSGRDRAGAGPGLEPGRGVPPRFAGVRRTEIPSGPAAEVGDRVQPPVHVRERSSGPVPGRGCCGREITIGT